MIDPEDLPVSPEDPRHSTNAGYVAGCREQCCRAASASRRAANRKRAILYRTPATRSALGSRRRVQALMAIGWRQQDIAEAGGWATKGEIRETFVRERVFVPTAQRIDEVYQKLCMTRGPSQNSREYAARHHWPPPLAWDNIDDPNELPDGWQRGHETKPKVADDLIVRAVIDGARAPQGISVADRRAVARELTTRGRTASEVALRCGVTREVVEMDLRRTA